MSLICSKTNRPTSESLCDVCNRKCEDGPYKLTNLFNIKDTSVNKVNEIIDDSISFWESKREGYTAIGDVHGRHTASTLVSSLNHIRSEIGKLNEGAA